MKKYSGDWLNWNKNFNEDNNFWENIEKERFINDESNIYESIIIKMKRFTYLSMNLVLAPLQKMKYMNHIIQVLEKKLIKKLYYQKNIYAILDVTLEITEC